ncbi:MAG: PAS domain S-box protein [Candidatus Hydrogenedentes bacterium]|nr:PAS domain S-box protein [Candidatus Hydrogenedentota bacterium]
MAPIDEARLSLVLTVEKVALIARYAVYFLLLPFFIPSWSGGHLSDLIIVTTIVVLHNVYVHWVFRTQRYSLFLGWPNFLAYYLEITLITMFTGADTSEAYLLYFLLLIGYSAYTHRLKQTVVCAGLCCLAYGAVILIERRIVGLEITPGSLVARFLGIMVCGWLVGSLSARLLRSEEDFVAQAQVLAASEATLRTILDSAADAILVFDENEFITEANDAACAFVGAPREHLLGRRIRSFLFDDGTLASKMAALRTRGEYHGEQILVNVEEDERTVDFRVRSFIRDQKLYFVAVVRDITEQKNLQEATRLANLNLERLNRELRQIDQLKTGFITAVSRKLRSPLTAVLGYVEMLIGEELGEVQPEQRRALQTCRRATLRIFRLLDDSLAVRRLESARGNQSDDPPKDTL